MQSIYFIMCSCIDVLVRDPSQSRLVKVKDFIHSSLAFPVAMVFILYSYLILVGLVLTKLVIYIFEIILTYDSIKASR